MLGWLKKKSQDLEEANIRRTLSWLIPAANEAAASVQRSGAPTAQQLSKIQGAQKHLMMDFLGPIPMDEVWARILEPELSSPGTSDMARAAVTAAFRSALTAQTGGKP